MVLNPIKRYGYVGDGRKAMLLLKQQILDKVMLRRTKKERAADVRLPPLEVFRCTPVEKGWGVRATEDIPAGTYITEYIGELLGESEAEARGIAHGDEYLMNLEQWAQDV